jgi:hypothetical protein
MRVSAALALVVAVVVALGGIAGAQPARLSPDDLPVATDEPPHVDLLTFGVGPRIFEKFGHAAICLRWPNGQHDAVCFNYGVTNFNAGSSMVWDFLRTQQKFWVDAESYSSVMRFYQREDRDIFTQELPLSPEQARAIEAKLHYDLEDEHKYYFYDHFYDNCTTRLRDLIDTATGGKLRDGSDASFGATFRAVGLAHLAEFPFVPALTDFVLGRQLDETPTVWQAMFLPEVLRAQVERKLGVAPELINKRHGPPFPTDGPTNRPHTLALAFVFALPLLVAQWRRRFQRVALAWATLYLTLWGLVIWGLAMISSIPGVRWNEAVLVLMPLDVALPFLPPALRRRYASVRVAMLLLVSALAGIGVFHQPLWIPILTAIMPLAIVAFDLPRRQAVVART